MNYLFVYSDGNMYTRDVIHDYEIIANGNGDLEIIDITIPSDPKKMFINWSDEISWREITKN